jgi:hypothetical protein
MPSTEEQLKGFSFYKDYEKKRTELVDRARGVYSAFKGRGILLTKDECKAAYGDSLDGCNLFVDEMAKKKPFLGQQLYRSFALLLAEYVVEKHWTEIESH